MRPPLSYVPLLPAFVMLAAGIVVSRFAEDESWLFVAAMACVSVAFLLIKKRFVAVSVAAAAMGCVISMADVAVHLGDMPADGVHRAGGVVASVTDGNASMRYIVELDGRYRGNCYVTVHDFEQSVRAGDRIEFTSRFEGFDERKDVDGDIDLGDFYYRHHIAGRATVLHDSISVTGAEPGFMWAMERQRSRVTDSIACSRLSPVAQELVAALLLGDDSLLDGGMRPEFAGAGIAHVLALSGMHVAVIAALLSWLLFPLAWAGYRRLRWLIVIGALWMYALFTGMSPSVTRAVCMFTVMLIAKCLDRHYSSANALFFAAIAILVFAPRQLFAPGFQLSFMAVLSMIVIPAVIPQVSSRHRLVRCLRDYFVYSLAAVIGTMPLAAYYFHLLPVYFLVANVPCAVAVPAIIAVGAPVLILQMSGLHVAALDSVIDALCGFVTVTAEKIAGAPHATFDGIYMSGWCVAALYAAVILTVVSVYYRKWLPSVVAVPALLLAVVLYVGYRDVPDVLFVGRSSQSTDVIMTSNGAATLVSTVPERGLDDEARYVLKRYAEFFGRRGIDSLTVKSAENAMIGFGGKKIAVINRNFKPDSALRADYVIVCGRFKGDVCEFAAVAKCDTILLGTDINARRRRRYEKELSASGYAVRSLSDGYGLVIESRE